MKSKDFIYSPSGKKWLYDEYSSHAGLSFKIEKVLVHKKSQFQDIKIVQSVDFGKVLLLNNWIYRTEHMGSVVPEMLVHIPMHTGKKKKRVLLIGGGDVYSAYELTRYKELEQIDVVDIDELVVQYCTEYFPLAKKAFSDNRIHVHIAEGAEFTTKSRDTYDLILITGTEAFDSDNKPGISYSLFQKPFHKLCFKRLSQDGILLSDAQNAYYGGFAYKKVNQNLQKFFPIVKNYTATGKYIPGGMYVCTVASKEYDPETDIRACAFDDLTYYSTKIHQHAFVLPAFLLH